MKSATTSRGNGPQPTTKSKGEVVAKRMAVASCAKCVFLRGAADAGFAGACHRSAPPAGLIRFATESVGVSTASYAIWPLVRATDSCGEFLKRPVK
jgi:hypothetical protein